jgi:lysophospholipase L1-like esterase
MKKQSELLITSCIVVVSILLTCSAGELFLRFFFADRLKIHEDERSILYRYDQKLGWSLQQNLTRQFTGSKTVMVRNNSRGFRDIEHQPELKPGIMFIGDSFVWGYDVEADDRFTEKLRNLLPDWNIYNLGVSGYSTDQELLLLKEQFEYYKPSIVFLVFCSYNDSIDNSANNIFKGLYYKPYFDPQHNMALKGIPVPKSLTYFCRQHPGLSRSYLIRLLVKAFAPRLITVEDPTRNIIQEMKQYVTQHGSTLVIGLTEPHGSLEYFLRTEKIPFLQLDGVERFPDNGWHWTPAGHTAISERIYQFLKGHQLLSPEPSTKPVDQTRSQP